MSQMHRATAPSRFTSEVLLTKLMPPRLHTGILERDDLLAKLDEGLSKKLTIVAAPTGFGKTTLVSQWLASREFPSAWVTLDKNDNDPARFWTYVISAIRTFDAAVGKKALSLLMSASWPSSDALLNSLLNDLLQLKDTGVLVLEDYHTINSAEIHEGLTFLVQHLPETLHLVLITRSEPRLPLAVLRAHDEILEIQAADLRFNLKETEAFLGDVLRADVPISSIQQLFQKTEGWAAGLRLAALSLKNRKGPAEIESLIHSFSGGMRSIADYLIQEVFEVQAESTQLFLLKTCFLGRLTGSLCDAVAGTSDGAIRLEDLERENLFLVQLDSSGGRIWYRYNPLFAESIQYLAGQKFEEAQITGLFEKASDWYEYQGLLDEAIETALNAKVFDRALGLMERYVEIHELSEMQTLARWLEQIPQRTTLLRPAICFTYAAVILYSSDRFAPATAARMEPFLRAAESAWRAEQNYQRLGELLSFRGIVVWWQGDLPKAAEYAYESLDYIPEQDVLWRGNSLLIVANDVLQAGQILKAQEIAPEVRAQMGAAQNIHGVLAALQLLSDIAYWQGESDQGVEINQQILAESIGGEEMLDDKGVASLGLARVAYEQNDLERAEPLAMQALNFAQRRANEVLQVQTTICLAYIHAAKNDLAGAGELLTALTPRIQNPSLLAEVRETQARLAIRAGDLHLLQGWVAVIAETRQNVSSSLREREAFTLARLRIAEGRPDEALAVLQTWKVDAAGNGRVRSQVVALCLEALARQALSDRTQAMQCSVEALLLGHAKGFRRLFLDEGPRMAELLQAILPSLPNRTLSLLAATLLHSFLPKRTAPFAASRSPAPVEALSQQELRVLRLLVTGMSNADMAKELVVSTNTIKTQVKSIYRKLDVKSRSEAGEVARELKLI
ncbi:MAG TPA: LuxR C-terminal-related transcriptional regulator [Anaerolineales bacterium]|nr:LuxR C-terminal-related transcriptional regulator [Anaerolineales bacterium]